ncbi:MAG: hypothetical protein KJ566_02550 [Nanoarchaeota archaeon]|nr:hypothetical protein [Nanoarchaeota archaeon]
MGEKTKEQIIEIIMALYKIPGQYFIAGIIAIGIGESFLEITNGGILLIILGIFFFILEILSPIIAGKELYEKAKDNLKKIFT